MVREALKPKRGEPMEIEALTIKGVLITEDRRGNAQSKSTATDGMKLRRKSSIANQVVADTPPIVGSASGRTLNHIVWSFEEPLTRLSEN